MDIMEAIRARHSVRRYLDKPIEEDKIAALREEIALCNREGNLHIQLVTDEPKAFDGFMAHYGKFSGVRNYFAMIGPKGDGLDERVGYYGERLVLLSQTLGLNTCWVALTFRKGKVPAAVEKGEKMACVISLGYGETQGTAHRSKPMESLCEVDGPMPDWFRKGMEAALLAPTAVNQQKFMITLKDGKVTARSTGGFCSGTDLGIVKYHFEAGAGTGVFSREA